jgi:hypothetical protein
LCYGFGIGGAENWRVNDIKTCRGLGLLRGFSQVLLQRLEILFQEKNMAGFQ